MVCVYDIKTGQSRRSGLTPARMLRDRKECADCLSICSSRHCHRSQTYPMTTIMQLKRAVRPLLERNPDLALVGRLVIIRRIHHILRGIVFARGIYAEQFNPIWATLSRFEPHDSLSSNWAKAYMIAAVLGNSPITMTCLQKCIGRLKSKRFHSCVRLRRSMTLSASQRRNDFDTHIWICMSTARFSSTSPAVDLRFRAFNLRVHGHRSCKATVPPYENGRRIRPHDKRALSSYRKKRSCRPCPSSSTSTRKARFGP